MFTDLRSPVDSWDDHFVTWIQTQKMMLTMKVKKRMTASVVLFSFDFLCRISFVAAVAGS